MNTQNNGISWLDSSLFPFQHNYIQLNKGKMHYIEKGHGDVILFIHGTPTWSFLYRNFVLHLSGSHRCIAIDHLGFGLSEKPDDFDGTPKSHAKNLMEFIQLLDLKNITLVVHDFGGPIGLSAAIKHQERIKNIVLLNTWLWATKDNPDVQKIDKIVRSFLGKLLYVNVNFSPKFLIKKGFSDQGKLTKRIHQHYVKPFPNTSSRYTLLKIAQSLAGSSDWYEEQWQQLDILLKKKWLFVWGMKDAFITPKFLKRWKSRIPDAQSVELNGGHFIQEENTTEAIKAIQEFVTASRS